MALTVLPILEALQSHAMASGYFDRVNRHEPKKAPGKGLTAAIWVQRVAPAPTGHGLATSTGVVTASVRVYTNMLAEPQDAIDPAVVAAVDALIVAYSGDFTLGGLVRNVDLLGQAGTALSAEAGYLTQDKTLFRVMTLTVPMIVNDAWTQAP